LAQRAGAEKIYVFPADHESLLKKIAGREPERAQLAGVDARLSSIR
jgi:hypothetical protein